MRVRNDVNDGASPAGADDGWAEPVKPVIEADCFEDDVVSRVVRLQQLNDEARGEFEAAEENLSTVRLTFDRARAGDFDPEPMPVSVEPVAPAALATVAPRSRIPALLAVASLASIAITAGLVVSLNAATPGQPVPADVMPAVAVTQTAPVSTPVAGGPDDLGARIYAARFAKSPATERACLARAIYYEARGEEMDGQIAVAQVVLNRARSKKWPETICGVVNQGIERGEKCQFSFACFSHLSTPSGPLWDQAQQVAEQAVNGQAWLRELAEATYYHTTSVAPVWRTALMAVTTIGTPIFYRDPDGLQTASFDEGRYQSAVAAGVQAADTARAKAAAAARVRAKVTAGAVAGRKTGGSADDWRADVFSR